MNEVDIEKIVREIVHRLRAEMTAPSSGSTLTLEAGVITMVELRGQLEGVQKLIVKPCAVVTPLVRDELTDRNIELIRGAE